MRRRASAAHGLFSKSAAFKGRALKACPTLARRRSVAPPFKHPPHFRTQLTAAGELAHTLVRRRIARISDGASVCIMGAGADSILALRNIMMTNRNAAIRLDSLTVNAGRGHRAAFHAPA